MLQQQIDTLEGRKDRLRDLYLLEDYSRDEYRVLRNDLVRQIEELERKLGGADYPLETVLARITNLSAVMCEGTMEQQKRAIGLLFKNISVGFGRCEAEPQPWARPLIVDLAALAGRSCASYPER